MYQGIAHTPSASTDAAHLQDQLKGVAHLEAELKRKELDVVWAAYQRNKDEVSPQPLASTHPHTSAFLTFLKSDAGACPCV